MDQRLLPALGVDLFTRDAIDDDATGVAWKLVECWGLLGIAGELSKLTKKNHGFHGKKIMAEVAENMVII